MVAKRSLLLFIAAFFTFPFFKSLVVADGYVANGQAIAAYGTSGAYLITGENEILKWGGTRWEIQALTTPQIRQMDCLNDGSSLIGTDNSDHVKRWNGLTDFASHWSNPRGTTAYDWVMIDPITKRKEGLLAGGVDIWDFWGAPAGGGAWNEYLPAGQQGSSKMKDLILVDSKSNFFSRWERGDDSYRVALNRSGEKPFKIFYYGESPSYALTRMIDPPIGVNPDTVLVKQISYDETEQNLWAIDTENQPWQWDNDQQIWILRNLRGEEAACITCCALRALLREQNSFYVRVKYVEGTYKPRILVFKDSQIMHLVLGERSIANFNDIECIIYDEEPDRPTGRFHNLLLKPKKTPQKIIRKDGEARISENHYLERLLLKHNIIADADAIGVYPAEHRIVRR